jgi:uncharacterized glyoxalase superfamily protein PhnB
MESTTQAVPTTDTLRITQLTPVVIVDRVEPSVRFWIDRLGFEQTIEVPGEDGLVFACVRKGGVEIMYQTRASVIDDGTAIARELDGRSIVLFLTVDDIDAVERALEGAPVVKARHDTFYGATEIYVREPGGHTVGFAQMNTKEG